MVRAGSPQSVAAGKETHGLDDFARLGPGVGPGEVGEDRVENQRASVKPAARACSRSSRARVILPSREAAGREPGVQKQEHQVGLVRRGQGQDVPEFVKLQGAGVEDGRFIGHRQTPGQDPGVRAVQKEGEIGDLLDRFHHEGHAVVAPGRQKAGVDVDAVGPGLLAAAGQFLERPGVEGLQGLGHHRIEDVEVVRGNDQGHGFLTRSPACTC